MVKFFAAEVLTTIMYCTSECSKSRPTFSL